ncbi:MAG TPA: membrane protein insertion efficiency factor YidD [Saprospiraceae bacterium]|nr:membrane protein insertion efficiency factor YidD [Saprospiraceae bacterium]
MSSIFKLLSYFILGPVRLYQIFLSPLLGKNCRFEPTCSNYMIQAVKEWGPFYGFWLGLRRISRCHPWGHCGEDPVPKNPKRNP